MPVVMPVRASIGLLLASIVASSLASPVLANSCMSPEEVEKHINSCGENVAAAEYAQKCLTIIKNESGTALAALRMAESSRDRQALGAAINDLIEKIKLI